MFRTMLKKRFKRIKRKWYQLIDPEFDGDQHDSRTVINHENSNYYEADVKIAVGKVYCLFINEDDESDMMFRKLIFSDGEEYYTGLDDSEFNEAWNLIMPEHGYPPISEPFNQTEKPNSSFVEELKEILSDYQVFEEDDGSDQ